MANFTTELRTICEHYGNDNKPGGYSDIDTTIENALPYIFDDFEIFDDNYREALETKIVKHFYTREIAYETVPLWKFKLNTKLNEIMPLYNQLYKSELLKFDPLYDIDLYTDHSGKRKTDEDRSSDMANNRKDSRQTDRTLNRDNDEKFERIGTDVANNSSEFNRLAEENRKNNENSTNNTNTNNDSRVGEVSRDLYSDTPQGSLDGIENGNYLTNARKIATDTHTVENGNENSQGNVDSTGNTNNSELSTQTDKLNKTTELNDTKKSNEQTQDNTAESVDSKTNSNRKDVNKIRSTDEYAKHVYGHTGGKNYSQLLVDFRKTFLNIDMMIIEELEPLFMGLYF